VNESERRNSDLELHALLYAQPVKIAQYQRHVVEFSLNAQESRSSAHKELQLFSIVV
jgi:hypothetical protein